ncbi:MULTISPECIES: PPOX class F420-dependent oxidoreductase [unclassified Nocardioides]|uniref:PPOX class F420-dependent oxidoreductase n=1 Tax=unclassified Nocardioides TaxID=2615069 RepID=UPI0009E9051A|nr:MULTISPECIES: PPOX class F420-dependent oxidoreductase [unclassified Nocardioides]
MRLPESLTRRLIKSGKKPMNAMRAPEAMTVLDRPVQHTDFSALAGHVHVLLVTYKRDGTPIPSPVWFARDGETLYVWTEINAFKAKRIRNDPRALLAPCDARGVPEGDPIAARGRVLTDEGDRQRAARVIRSQWGLGRRIFELVSRPLTDVHYLAFEPALAA